jgi:hypothetical protein
VRIEAHSEKICGEANPGSSRFFVFDGAGPAIGTIEGWIMGRSVAALFLIAFATTPATAQVFNWVKLDRLNDQLCGKVIDFTQNHGSDRRMCSPILGRPRDLYVYLPPNYESSVAYPLIVLLHGAHIDEHAFLDPRILKKLDRMISQGEIPPVIIAAPDGTYRGENWFLSTHSLWVNGLGGRFEDHVVDEIVPLLMRTFSVRPEREAHALIGISAGGFGAMTIGIRHRDIFGVVATLGGPLNVRYDTTEEGYAGEFNPLTYRERIEYNPELLIATYHFGLLRKRAKEFFEPVYGTGPDVTAKVLRDNPSDLIAATDLQPGEMAIYVSYPGRDNYNFDAQAQSFAWLAARRGIAVETVESPSAFHDLSYIQGAEPPAYLWLGRHLLPPIRR